MACGGNDCMALLHLCGWISAGVAWAGLYYLYCTGCRWHISAYERVKTLFARRWVREALVLAVLGVVSAALLQGSAFGDRLMNRDHQLHYLNTVEMLTLLKQGSLYGWSHLHFAGYPVNYAYPFGANLWILGVYAAGLGLLTLSQAYGVGVWLFYWFLGWSIYFVGRQLTRTPFALFAAIIFLGSYGDFRIGGTYFTLMFGVWPQSLGLAFGLCSLVFLDKGIRQVSLRALGIFAALMGAGILCHPMLCLFYAVIYPVYLLTVVCWSNLAWRQAAGRLSLGYVLGICVGGLWMVPFLNVKDYIIKAGYTWLSLTEIGYDLSDMTFMGHGGAWITALGLAGLVLCLRSRCMMRKFVALLSAIFLLLSSQEFTSLLQAILPGSDSKFVQFQRFILLLRPFWIIGVGIALEQIWLLMPPLARTAQAVDRKRLAWHFIAAVVMAPLIMAFSVSLWKKTFFSQKLTPLSEYSLQEDRKLLAAWTKEHLPHDVFYRYGLNQENISAVEFGDLALELGAPVFRTSLTPAELYRYKLRGDSDAILRLVNVRYFISTEPYEKEHMKLLQQFGTLYLYEFTLWNPQPFELISGAADVHVKEFGKERIVLSVKAKAPGQLLLNVSYFPRWGVTINGKPGVLQCRPIRGVPNSGFIMVALEDGEYVFEFHQSWVDVSAQLFFVFGVGVIILLCVFGRWKQGRNARANA